MRQVSSWLWLRLNGSAMLSSWVRLERLVVILRRDLERRQHVPSSARGLNLRLGVG